MAQAVYDEGGVESPVAAARRAQAAAARRATLLRWGLPVLFGALILGGWELFVWYKINIVGIGHYNHILPAPSVVVQALVEDWHILWPGWLVTLWITAKALFWAVLLGVGLAIAFSLSKWIEYSFFPYAVVLQVTPIVAIAPLIITLLDDLDTALLVCAWIVAFFPILSNTIIGLRSVDHGLLDLYQMYGASRWRVMLDLRLPSALPFFLAALKISAGLSLIGAVVGEFVAYGQSPGLAARIVEASYLLKVPRMFAALTLISLTGIVLFLLFSLISNLALRSWHESALKRER
ncbi:MAG: ABC transporter permease [Alphaproteobacteria bacterium]